MKVLQINKFLYPKGGAETYMFQLSNALKNAGIEMAFWGMADPQNIVADRFNSFAKNKNFQTAHVSQQISMTFDTIYSSANRKKLSVVLDRFQPDIIHLHNYNFQLTPALLPEIKKRGIKIVQTVHDSQMVCPYHRLYNFQKNSICTKCVTGSFTNCIKDRCFEGSLLKSSVGALESMLYHRLNFYDKYIDHFIFPSRFLAELVQKKVRVNAFDILPNFTDRLFQIPKEKKDYYLYFGRISEEKGILELIDIFKDLPLTLIIIGSGELETVLVQKIKPLKNIRFLGPKKGKALFEYVANAKFVILPSSWYENCPMTVIESFACNTPVIGAKHSGFIDLIADKQTGFLLDFTDHKRIREKLLEIDSMNPKSFKPAIQKEFETRFSKQGHLKKILEIYNTVLRKN